MGGGTCEKNPTEAKTYAHLMQNWAIFCYFKHEIQLFKVLMSLIVKFDTKMSLIFFQIFGDEPRLGGGTSLGPKTGTGVGWAGLTKFLPDGGAPPGKNPASSTILNSLAIEWKI